MLLCSWCVHAMLTVCISPLSRMAGQSRSYWCSIIQLPLDNYSFVFWTNWDDCDSLESSMLLVFGEFQLFLLFLSSDPLGYLVEIGIQGLFMQHLLTRSLAFLVLWSSGGLWFSLCFPRLQFWPSIVA